MDIQYVAAVCALIGAPALGPCIYWGICRLQVQARRRVLIALMSCLVIVIIATTVGISMRGHEVNVVILCLGYISFAVLASSLFRFRPRIWGVALGCVAFVPIVGGFVLGTFGHILMLWILYDAKPRYTGATQTGLSCYVTTYGNATTSFGGYSVVWAKPLPVLSFLEYTVSTRGFENPDFGFSDACKKSPLAIGSIGG